MKEEKTVISSINDLAVLERRVSNLSKLVYINGIINSTLDIGRLLTIIMEIIKDIMECEASTLLLYDQDEHDLVFKVALGESGKGLVEKYRVEVGQGIAGWVAENRKTIYVNDVYKDKRFDPKFDKETGFTTKSIACTPLLYKGELLGVIQAINPQNRPGFDDGDMELFNVFANQASLAVQNAVFFQNALEEERIKVELESARSLQDTLIPDINDTFANIHVVAKSKTVREVGGEFHSLYRINGNFAIALCDLHEKGIPGGINASLLNGSLKALAGIIGNRPVKLIKYLSSTMFKDMKSFKNISFFYGFLDISKGEIHFVNDGVAYPILIRGRKSMYLKFRTMGGMKNADEVKQVQLKLKKGDFFVIISDSILNFKNRNGQTLGLKKIMKFLEGAFPGPDEMIDSLIRYAEDFSSGLERREDVSIIVFMVQ